MQIKGIIFDFDGTIFDSMGIWETAGKEYLASIGIEAEKDLHKKILTMSLAQSAEYMQSEYSLSLTMDEIMLGINKTVEDFYINRAMPKEGAIQMLEMLQAKGIKMCIATATDRYHIEAALMRCNMTKYFDGIFTCTEVGHGKDSPQIFEYACDHLGTDKNETAVFEDAYHAALTAKNAGFYVVGVYDKSEKKTEKIKEFADLYVDHLDQVAGLLPV